MDIQVEQMISGIRSNKRKKIYKDSAEKLKVIINNYDTTPALEYLKGIAYNFSLQV